MQSRAVQYRRAELCNTAEPSCELPQGRAVTGSRSELCKLAERILCIENSACRQGLALPAAELAAALYKAKSRAKLCYLAELFGASVSSKLMLP